MFRHNFFLKSTRSQSDHVLYVNFSTHVPVYILHREVRQGHGAQLDRVAEGQPCPSPLCRGRMASSHYWQLPLHARGQHGKSGRSHTLLCQSRQERIVALPVFHPSTGQAGMEGWRMEGGRGEEQREREKERERERERERGWVTSLFFHLLFNWPLSAFTRVKCSLYGGHRVPTEIVK